VNIRGKVAHCRLDPAIERASVSQMAAEAHARGADAAIAGVEGEKVVDAEAGVFVVSGQFLLQWVSRHFWR
jgi:hypothetical protein